MMAIVVIITAILIIIVGSQLLKIAELNAQNKGEKIYEISEKQGKSQALFLFIFLFAYMGFFAWQMYAWYGLRLPVSGSEHGEGYDSLNDLTYLIITPVFIITHIFLLWFSFKYAYAKNRKALFFSHSNKLEILWTTLPSLVLAILIIVGLSNWNKIMKPIPAETDHVLLEVTAQQFTWTARYAGKDKRLGRSHVTLIEGTNATGVDATDEFAADDKLVKGEFHLPVGVPVQFLFRSIDVIHSAYMPHFRAQMNCVPGLKTQFNFTPIKTTKEMREITGNDEFNYILLCNKICGAAHYNMQMDIIVESKEDYEKWLADQKTFVE